MGAEDESLEEASRLVDECVSAYGRRTGRLCEPDAERFRRLQAWFWEVIASCEYLTDEVRSGYWQD